MPKRVLRFLTGLAAALIAVSGLLGCSVNTATGRNQFNMLSTSDEISIGSQAAPEYVKQFGGEIPDAHIRQYIADLGQQLATEVVKDPGRQSLPWEFFTVDSQMINAFALPGGKVFVTRGLLEKMENDAQLVSVLGHEVGHVTGKHIGEQMTRAMIIQIGVGAAAAASDEEWVGLLAGTTGGLYMLRFSREHETESDELGMRYMTAIGYDPVGMLQVMEIFQAESDGGGVEFLQTHPLPTTRIERIERRIATRYAHTQNNPEYVLGVESFRINIADRLKRLPPAKHDPSAEPDEPSSEASSARSRGR